MTMMNILQNVGHFSDMMNTLVSITQNMYITNNTQTSPNEKGDEDSV